MDHPFARYDTAHQSCFGETDKSLENKVSNLTAFPNEERIGFGWVFFGSFTFNHT